MNLWGQNPFFFDSVIGKPQCMHPTHTLSIMSMKEQYKGFKWESTYSVCFIKRSLNKQRCTVWHTNQWRKTFVMVGNYTAQKSKQSSLLLWFSFPFSLHEEKRGKNSQGTPKLDLREGKNLPLFINVLPHKSKKCTTVCSKHSWKIALTRITPSQGFLLFFSCCLIQE